MQIFTSKLAVSAFLITVLSWSQPLTADTKVYICDNGKTNKYHLKNDCRGLSRCTYRIVERKLVDVKKEGMTLCGYEN